MGMIDGVKRALGMHVHDWEAVGSREAVVQRPARWSGSEQRGATANPYPFEQMTIPIVTYRCRTCGKQRESEALA